MALARSVPACWEGQPYPVNGAGTLAHDLFHYVLQQIIKSPNAAWIPEVSALKDTIERNPFVRRGF